MVSARINTASPLSQWQEIVIARVCIAAHEELAESSRADLTRKAWEMYSYLVQYDNMQVIRTYFSIRV